MEAQDLAEKVKNNQIEESDLIHWCKEHLDTMDLSKSSHRFLYESVTQILMQKRINNLSEEEAILLIRYLPSSYLHEKGLADRTKISVMSSEDFEEKYHRKDLYAMCLVFQDLRFQIDYSSNVIELIRSGSINEFLEGLKCIYHETTHVVQEASIRLKEINGERVHYRASLFRIAQENIARIEDPNFYAQNYTNLVLENQANRIGLTRGYFAIKKYAPQYLWLYSEKKILAEIQEYKKQEESDVVLFGNKGKRYVQLDNICNKYVASNPEKALEKYPILQLAYNPDGSKKDISTLLKDRQDMLESGEEEKSVNGLYRTIFLFTQGLNEVTLENIALEKEKTAQPHIVETSKDER